MGIVAQQAAVATPAPPRSMMDDAIGCQQASFRAFVPGLPTAPASLRLGRRSHYAGTVRRRRCGGGLRVGVESRPQFLVFLRQLGDLPFQASDAPKCGSDKRLESGDACVARIGVEGHI